MKSLSLDGTEALSTFNRHIPNSYVSKMKEVSDIKNDTDDLTFAATKKGVTKSRACIEFGNSVERKRLADEIKEVWEH